MKFTKEEKNSFIEDVRFYGLDEAVGSWVDELKSQYADSETATEEEWEAACKKAQQYVEEIADACGYSTDSFCEPYDDGYQACNKAMDAWSARVFG